MRLTFELPAPGKAGERPPSAEGADKRGELFEVANAHARRLRLPALDATAPIIATGHQAALWHPGILAKYFAVQAVAQQRGAAMLNVVVDQDAHDALTLELPVRDGQRLAVQRVTLAEHQVSVPTGAQPSVNAQQVSQTLDRFAAQTPGLAADLQPLRDAWCDLPETQTLAEQIAVVLHRLLTAVGATLPTFFATDMLGLAPAKQVLERMLADPASCAQTYNDATLARPEAGITPLALLGDRVELPLWVIPWREPRQRVFAILDANARTLIDDAGEPIDRARDQLAPRALLLSALMRSCFCDLFIHGRGGGIYDVVTDAWWQAWLNQPLAPRGVVSADLQLPFDVPVADRGQLEHAQWRAHHLPHNLDRTLNLDGELRSKKQHLLTHMDDDRDRQRRRIAFDEIHRINDRLRQQHPEPLQQAQAQLERMRIGVGNRAVARKRDWCFALYPQQQLDALRDAVRRRAAAAAASPVIE